VIGWTQAGLQPMEELAACQQDSPTAAQALEPNVGPQADDDPIRAAAGMRLA